MLLHPYTTWGDIQDICGGEIPPGVDPDSPTQYFGYTWRQVFAFHPRKYVLTLDALEEEYRPEDWEDPVLAEKERRRLRRIARRDG